MEKVRSDDRQGMLFSQTGLAANSALSGVGAGAAIVAATGALFPALLVGALGASLTYVVTNQIRKEP
ncbi:hypothetical protein ACLBKT_01630 [Erythrobacter sp. W302b]|uniref:hypothetical protein n=1 Tax=Erythrobacter sp. W302b TaxID=3389874 RepID=UPI00396B2642